ncbi:B3 domain-containing transcription factor ABI3 [Linum perenne]
MECRRGAAVSSEKRRGWSVKIYSDSCRKWLRQRRFISHRSRHNINPAGVENDERQFDPTLVQQQQGNQGWKAEKNLRFLLQKVLKQSDIGSLGRIVLPKKEAEMHLPELEARDGISIAMEDIETSRVWNMRYNSSIRFD